MGLTFIRLQSLSEIDSKSMQSRLRYRNYFVPGMGQNHSLAKGIMGSLNMSHLSQQSSLRPLVADLRSLVQITW